jgi:cation:H+ antiporter
VSPLFVGLTIVGFGTSTPELGASVSATLDGASAVSVGNVVGSNLFNVGAILGLTALVRPIHVHFHAVRRDLLVALGAALALFASGPLGGVPPWFGAVLLGALGVYLVTSYRAARAASAADETLAAQEVTSTLALPHETAPQRAPLWTNVALVLAGLALLLGGAHLFVGASLEIARGLGVPELVIGLTLVSVGTSLPELVTSVVAARRGNADIAVGNVIGSNIFNLLGILGVAALVGRQDVPRAVLLIDAPLMVLSMLALLPILRNDGRISRTEGGLLLGGYLAYAAGMALRG